MRHQPTTDGSICGYCREPWPCVIALGYQLVMEMMDRAAEGKPRLTKQEIRQRVRAIRDN